MTNTTLNETINKTDASIVNFAENQLDEYIYNRLLLFPNKTYEEFIQDSFLSKVNPVAITKSLRRLAEKLGCQLPIKRVVPYNQADIKTGAGTNPEKATSRRGKRRVERRVHGKIITEKLMSYEELEELTK